MACCAACPAISTRTRKVHVTTRPSPHPRHAFELHWATHSIEWKNDTYLNAAISSLSSASLPDASGGFRTNGRNGPLQNYVLPELPRCSRKCNYQCTSRGGNRTPTNHLVRIYTPMVYAIYTLIFATPRRELFLNRKVEWQIGENQLDNFIYSGTSSQKKSRTPKKISL